MKKAALNTVTTLLLDYKHAPVGLLSARDAFTGFFTDRMNGFDKDFRIYKSADEWYEGQPSLHHDHPYIDSVNQSWTIPTILQSDRKFVVRKRKRISLKEMCKITNFTCQICHNQFNYKELTREHIIPRSAGGSNDLSNITLTCVKCNNKKASITPYRDTRGKPLKPLFDNVIGNVVSHYDRPEWAIYDKNS
jgi:hypothetical protein